MSHKQGPYRHTSYPPELYIWQCPRDLVHCLHGIWYTTPAYCSGLSLSFGCTTIDLMVVYVRSYGCRKTKLFVHLCQPFTHSLLIRDGDQLLTVFGLCILFLWTWLFLLLFFSVILAFFWLCLWPIWGNHFSSVPLWCVHLLSSSLPLCLR